MDFCQLQDPEKLQALATQDLNVSEERLQSQLMTQPERYFFWGKSAAKAEAARRSQEYRVKEILWPEARNIAREGLKRTGGKITEGNVDDIAMLNSDYRQGVEELVKAEEFSATLRAAEQAMRQRMEMLRSLNSRQRADYSA